MSFKFNFADPNLTEKSTENSEKNASSKNEVDSKPMPEKG